MINRLNVAAAWLSLRREDLPRRIIFANFVAYSRRGKADGRRKLGLSRTSGSRQDVSYIRPSALRIRKCRQLRPGSHLASFEKRRALIIFARVNSGERSVSYSSTENFRRLWRSMLSRRIYFSESLRIREKEKCREFTGRFIQRSVEMKRTQCTIRLICHARQRS